MEEINFSEYFVDEDGNLMDFNDRVNELLRLEIPIKIRFETPEELLKFVTSYKTE